MEQMSVVTGRDLNKLMSVFPQTSAKEGGRAVVEAVAKREAYVYFPKGQRLWLLKSMRSMLSDPDRWIGWAQDAVLRFVDWRDYLAGKLTWW